jgi:hypothetical protein
MLTELEQERCGSSNEWSRAITGASARLLGIPGYRHDPKRDAEHIARAYLTEVDRARPSTRALYSGHAMPPERLDEIGTGRTVRLPLTALSTDQSFARGFTTGTGVPVLLRFEKGTRAFRYTDVEWITAGTFVVKSMRRGLDPFWKTPLVTVALTRLDSA